MCWLTTVNPLVKFAAVFHRSITYDVGSKDESFEWMNVHRAPPSLVRPTPCGVVATSPAVPVLFAAPMLYTVGRCHILQV